MAVKTELYINDLYVTWNARSDEGVFPRILKPGPFPLNEMANKLNWNEKYKKN
jgi:hypothetical protein